MGEFKKTSRAKLYDSESEPENGSDEEFLGYGNMDFEFVEVDNETKEEVQEGGEEVDIDDVGKEEEEGQKEEDGEAQTGTVAEQHKTEDEYDFPLFGSKPGRPSEGNEDSEVAFPLFGNTMKVSLKEDVEDTIIQERPVTYYFASYTEGQEKEFQIAAISYEQVVREARTEYVDPAPWKVLDLAAYNTSIDKLKELQQAKKRKMRKRPGKKKREMKIKCTERKQERAKIEKKIEKDQLAKLKKKMFHKRGGKKNKKKTAADTSASKPKYRTE